MARPPLPTIGGDNRIWAHKNNAVLQDAQASLDRVDPGTAGTVGQSVRVKPGGVPAWSRDAVEADWYSNPNDAIAAARRVSNKGGVVKFSAESYLYDTDILLTPGLTLIAENPHSTTIGMTDGASIKVADLDSPCLGVVMQGFYLYSAEGESPVGMDMRGLSHASVRNVWVAGFTDAEVWFGGETFEGGWTNRWDGGRVIAPTSGAGMRFSGLATGGIAAANNNIISGVDILVQNAVDSIGIDMVEGDTNVFMGMDVGYSHGNDGTAFKFGAGAYWNKILTSRTEGIVMGWLIDGGDGNTAYGANFNTVQANAGSTENGAVGCDITTLIDNSGSFWRDGREQRALRTDYIAPSGSDYITGKETADAYKRFGVGSKGQYRWYDPTTGDWRFELGLQNDFWKTWGPSQDMRLMIPPQTTLPMGQEVLRGALVRIEGGAGVKDGVYVCVKDATDAYIWQALY